MGKQSARLWYELKDHKDIIFGGYHHDKMYVGGTLVWEKIEQHPLYSQFFMVGDVISSYGPHVVDEYGVRLALNEGAVVEKCAVYLTGSGSSYKRTIACTGTGITSAKYVPYLAYQGKIIYDGLNTSGINTFVLSKNSYGVWNYSNYSTINANLTDANGKALTAHSTGVDTENTRLFYNLTEMKNWLQS